MWRMGQILNRIPSAFSEWGYLQEIWRRQDGEEEVKLM
jgi:hypothetical protein